MSGHHFYFTPPKRAREPTSAGESPPHAPRKLARWSHTPPTHSRCTIIQPLQLPCGLLMTTIQAWIPEHSSTPDWLQDNEFCSDQWYALQRAAHVNRKWQAVVESFPIIGSSMCHIVSQNLPLLVESRLDVRGIILEYIFQDGNVQLTDRQRHPISERSTLTTVSKLDSLEHLTLRYFRAPDISVLISLNSLTSLTIQCPFVASQWDWRVNLQPLAYMTLTTLGLIGFLCINVADVVSQRETLTTLTIKSELMDNPALLKELVGLTSLTIESPQFNQVSYLTNMPSLTDLNLSFCQMRGADLSLLSGLDQLTNLILVQCDIRDLSVLMNLRSLRYLDVSDNHILTDVSPLNSLSHLQSLKMARCSNVTDLASLSNIPSLTLLDLTENEGITNFDFLGTLNQLQTLRLSTTRIRDLSPLRSLCVLRRLYLPYCRLITDISHLSWCPNLTLLALYGCDGVTDHAALPYTDILLRTLKPTWIF